MGRQRERREECDASCWSCVLREGEPIKRFSSKAQKGAECAMCSRCWGALEVGEVGGGYGREGGSDGAVPVVKRRAEVISVLEMNGWRLFGGKAAHPPLPCSTSMGTHTGAHTTLPDWHRQELKNKLHIPTHTTMFIGEPSANTHTHRTRTVCSTALQLLFFCRRSGEEIGQPFVLPLRSFWPSAVCERVC